MDEDTASLRLCLLSRAEELQHILSVGIEDADWYQIASDCYVWLDSIVESERTPEEVSQRQRLLELTSGYEEQHYRFGN